MKFIVGLGNPGENYEGTRHNVGFMVVERVLLQIQNSKVKTQNHNLKFKTDRKLESEVCKVGEVILVKPMTFMNRSGEAIQKVLRYFLNIQASISNDRLNNLLVAHDDLDIVLGEYKLQMGKGPKVHKGVNSVEEVLKSKDFWRMRVGVENRRRGVERGVEFGDDLDGGAAIAEGAE